MSCFYSLALSITGCANCRTKDILTLWCNTHTHTHNVNFKSAKLGEKSRPHSTRAARRPMRNPADAPSRGCCPQEQLEETSVEAYLHLLGHLPEGRCAVILPGSHVQPCLCDPSAAAHPNSIPMGMMPHLSAHPSSHESNRDKNQTQVIKILILVFSAGRQLKKTTNSHISIFWNFFFVVVIFGGETENTATMNIWK